jgi:hypothetical protein
MGINDKSDSPTDDIWPPKKGQKGGKGSGKGNK